MLRSPLPLALAACLGSGDRYNPLFEVDQQPNGGTNVVDCNDYGNLSTAGNTVIGGFSANCPVGSLP
jgi:hypothetical protein